MSQPLKCPACQTDMVIVKCHQINVDRCPKCKGLWFDLLEHEDLKKVKNSADQIDEASRFVQPDSKKNIIDCPRCHNRMGSMHDFEQPHIVYEKCDVCHGVFFEAGEFKDFQEKTVAERLKAWAH